ncbi:uncharacterized protein LOC120476315 [Pimephales promelas]|uniref:uncharacterized protein LOC120476315 n=1 Tax=Pimephales promelas TaxID=90988 RepID=UPI001955AADE|nr:uncharacterized protein LOC120476315 [Pimephales promelas]
MKNAEWVGRVIHGSRVILRTKRKASILQQYYLNIRPHIFSEEKGCNRFFLTSSADAVHKDMNKLHSMYKLGISKSQNVRRAVIVGTTTGGHPFIFGRPLMRTWWRQPTSYPLWLGLVRIRGQQQLLKPACGGTLTSFWRPSLSLRRASLHLRGSGVKLSFLEPGHFMTSGGLHNIPRGLTILSVTSVCGGLISQEGWTTNCPKPEEVVRMWRPASKQKVKTDPCVHRCVAEQAWTGLAIKDFGPPKSFGVVATRNFASGDIVCDYHSKPFVWMSRPFPAAVTHR